MGKIINTNDETNFNKIITDRTIIVDFFATWCGPCKMLIKELEKASKEVDDYFLKVDIDEAQLLARKYNVKSVPTLILFKNGIEQERKSGFMPASEILAFLNKHK